MITQSLDTHDDISRVTPVKALAVPDLGRSTVLFTAARIFCLHFPLCTLEGYSSELPRTFYFPRDVYSLYIAPPKQHNVFIVRMSIVLVNALYWDIWYEPARVELVPGLHTEKGFSGSVWMNKEGRQPTIMHVSPLRRRLWRRIKRKQSVRKRLWRTNVWKD